MKIFGIINEYDLYSKIPITEEHFFDEYESGIEEVFTAILLNEKTCKTLRRATDLVWLQEYLRMITRHVTRTENAGEIITDEEIFEKFRLVCIRDRFYCKYQIDIFDGLNAIFRKEIMDQNRCYLKERCLERFIYRNVYDGEDIVAYHIFSEDIYNYDGYTPYFTVDGGNKLYPLCFTKSDDGLIIDSTKNGTFVPIEDIVIHYDKCFYTGITPAKGLCEDTASGVYNADGSYTITITPLTVEQKYFKLYLDGEETIIDGIDIVYIDGILTIKDAFKYNKVGLRGCPTFYGNIQSNCLYTFSYANTAENEIEITIGGATPLPTKEDIVIDFDGSTFDEVWGYNESTGKISFSIDELYYKKLFTLKTSTCEFWFSVDYDIGHTTLVIEPIIVPITVTKCDGCDLVTYDIIYSKDTTTNIPNTYSANEVEQEFGRIVGGCKTNKTIITYECDNDLKYERTTKSHKCIGDIDWTEDSTKREVMTYPGECDPNSGAAAIDPPADRTYDTCNGCDKETYNIHYVINEALDQYIEEIPHELLSTTTNGCKETFIATTTECINYKKCTVRRKYAICPGDSAQEIVGDGFPEMTVITPTEECLIPNSPLGGFYYECNGCTKEKWQYKYSFNIVTGEYEVDQPYHIVAEDDSIGCQQFYIKTEEICYNYEKYIRETIWSKCPGGSWTEGTPTDTKKLDAYDDPIPCDRPEPGTDSYTKCDGCDEVTYIISTVWDKTTQTWISSKTLNSTGTILDKCKQSYTEFKYKCEQVIALGAFDIQKYERTCVKCPDGTSWTCSIWTQVGTPISSPTKCNETFEGYLMEESEVYSQ